MRASTAAVGTLFAALLLTGCFSLGPAGSEDPEVSLAVRRAEAARGTPPAAAAVPEPRFDQGSSAKPSLPEATPRLSAAPQGPAAAPGRFAPADPSPPELTLAEARQELPGLLPLGWQAVTAQGQYLVLLHDLTGDRQPEAFALAVRTDDARGADMEQLADASRLDRVGLRPLRFAVLGLEIRAARLASVFQFDLGERWVLEGFERRSLSERDPNRTVVSVAFRSPSGRDEELLVCGGTPLRVLARTTLKQTLTVEPIVADIDGDGTIDILLRERGTEEGIGYETFLTWLRWDGERFTEYRATNVVRNLRDFLALARNFLIRGRLAEFLTIALEPPLAEGLRKEHLTDEEIAFQTIGLQHVGPLEKVDPRLVLGQIQDVVLPSLLEDPFERGGPQDTGVRLDVRLKLKNGTVLVARPVVYMLRNPFGDRQFSFRPGLDGPGLDGPGR